MTMRIALFRALYLGDLLLAVPALRAIRAHFSDAEITLIGLPWAASFARRYSHYIDRFVEFAGYPGIQEVAYDLERTETFLAEQRRYGYDLVVQMHGSGQTSNPFVLALNGRVTAGYYEGEPPKGLAPGTLYPHNQHEVFRNLGLAALLGCSDLDPKLEFPLFDEDHAEVAALLVTRRGGGGEVEGGDPWVALGGNDPDRIHDRQERRPWIGVHPGARPPARRWPVEYFAAVADDLVRRFDAQIILTGSPGEEAIVQAVVEQMKTQPVNLVGQTSLGGLAALISKLDLFLSNDTGPAHIACAVDTPSITIFGPADHQRWASLDQVRHPTARHPVACSPCGYWECPIDHRCLRWLRPETVVNIAERYLQKITIH